MIESECGASLRRNVKSYAADAIVARKSFDSMNADIKWRVNFVFISNQRFFAIFRHRKRVEIDLRPLINSPPQVNDVSRLGFLFTLFNVSFIWLLSDRFVLACRYTFENVRGLYESFDNFFAFNVTSLQFFMFEIESSEDATVQNFFFTWEGVTWNYVATWPPLPRFILQTALQSLAVYIVCVPKRWR